MRGENRSTRRKTSRSRVENQQTQPTYDADSGNRTRATLVGGERSTTAPTLLPRTLLGPDVINSARSRLPILGRATEQVRLWQGIENRGFYQIHFFFRKIFQMTNRFLLAEKNSKN